MPTGGPFGEEAGMFLYAAFLAALIGFAWLVCAVLRVPALRIDARGIRGFTLLGTREFAWADVDRLKVNWDATYKQQLTIHAVFGSATGGFGIFSPTSIPVMTGSLDQKLDAIIAAIKVYKPDIKVERNEVADGLAKLVANVPKIFRH